VRLEAPPPDNTTVYLDDADPFLVNVLDLLERIYHGRLIVPQAYDVFQTLSRFIPILRERLTTTAQEAELRRRLGNPVVMPPDVMTPPNPSPRGEQTIMDAALAAMQSGTGSATVMLPRVPNLPQKVKVALNVLSQENLVSTELGVACQEVVNNYLKSE
jgi:hypothetical protein